MDRANTIADEEDLIVEELSFFEVPRDTIEHIVELGKDLPPMAEELKNDMTLVRGCQSRVWMVAGLDPATGRMTLAADSDAVIVKGLVSLVLRLYADRDPVEVAASDGAVFERIGLGKMLTPGRQNGLYSMLARVRQLAEALSKAEHPREASR